MKRRLISILLTVCLLVTLIPATGSADVTVTYTTYSSKYSIGTTNAVLAKTISVSGAAISDVTQVGIQLRTTSGRVIGSKRETPTPLNGVINAWYDVNSELGCTLSPSTSYAYQFVAVIGGKDYWSPTYTFTTSSTGVTFSFSTYAAKESIGTTNAVLAKTISISGGSISSVTKVGINLYSQNHVLLKSKSETPTPSNGVINAWYDVNSELSYTLLANTLYRYEFFAVYGGVTYVSPEYTFTTAPVPVSSIVLTQSSVTLDLAKGETATIGATIYPTNASNYGVSWSSSNTSVATVSSMGDITPVGVGTATITCSAQDGSGVKATCAVTVTCSLSIEDVSSTPPMSDYQRFALPCTFSWSVTASGGVGTLLYRYQLYRDDTLYHDTGDVSPSTYDYTFTSPGTYWLTVTVKDSATGLTSTYTDMPFTLYQPVTSIRIPDALVLADTHPGNICALTATQLPAGCVTEPLSWSSSDESIVTVNRYGVVFAVAPGTASVTASVPSGISASTQITVRGDMSLVVLPDTLSTLEAEAFTGTATERVLVSDSTLRIGARAFADNAGLRYVYIPASTDSIASDAFEGSGNAVILCESGSPALAFAQANGLSYFCLDNADTRPVSAITLSQTAASVMQGNTLELTASVDPEDATDPILVWTSSDESVATVSDSGLITAVSVGNATITATAADGFGASASCDVTVTPVLVSSITLNASTASVMVGETYTLTATVSPDDAANKAITWSSSNTNVATVSASGVVTAKAVGTAIITAAATDGSGVKGTCTVTVTPILVTSITLSSTTLSLVSNTTFTLTATVAPANAANKTLTWSSSNTNSATVSSSGVITAKYAGSATITATAADGSGVKATCTVTVKAPTQASGVVQHPTITSGNRYYRLYPSISHLAYGATTSASTYASIINQFDVTWGETNPYVDGWYEPHTTLHPYTYCNYFAADVSLAMGAFFPLVNVCYSCGRPINSASFRSVKSDGSYVTTSHYMYTAMNAAGLLCSCDNRDAKDFSTGYLNKWFTGDDGSGENAYTAYQHASEFGWVEVTQSQAIAKANAGYLTIGVRKDHVFVVYPNGSTTQMYISQAGSNLMSNEKLPSGYTNFRYFYNKGK